MTQPRAIVLRTAGTNCDGEMVRAFELSGARTELVHVDRLIADPAAMERYDIIGLPGGFSYGDDVASGRVLALRLRLRLYPALRDAARRGAPIIGVCNGFQALVQLGMLPGPEGGLWPEAEPPAQSVALTDNAGARFIDEWVRVEIHEASPCVWTRELCPPQWTAAQREQVMLLPLASGEGRFVPDSEETLRRLDAKGQIPLRYVDNLNGSTGRIAGVCDESGLIFGLMPHPDRYLDWTLHPFWTRLEAPIREAESPGLRLFRNAVDAVRSGATAAARVS